MKKVFFVFLLLVLLCGCSVNQQGQENTPPLLPTATPTVAPTPTPTATPLPQITQAPSAIKDTNQPFVATVNTDILNMRAQASVSSPIVDKLVRGDIIEVMSVSDGWCKIHKVVSSSAQSTSSKYAHSHIGYCKAEYLAAVSNIASLYPGAVSYTLKSGEYSAQAFRYFAAKQTYGDATVEYYFTDVYIFDKNNNLYSIMPLSFAGYADKQNLDTHVLTSIYIEDFDSDGKDDCLYQLDYDAHTCYLKKSRLEHLRDFGPENMGVINLMLYRDNTLVNGNFADELVQIESVYSQEDFNSENLNAYVNVFRKLAQTR